MNFFYPLLLFSLACLQLNAQFYISKNNASCFGSCDGNAVVLPAGNYHYHWAAGDTTDTVYSLCAGSYYCIVTDSAGGYLDSVSTIINQPVAISVGGTIKNVCFLGANDGHIATAVTGGTPPYSYNWSDGNIGPNNYGLLAGNYIVTVSDSNACMAVHTFAVWLLNESISARLHTTAETFCPACDGSVFVDSVAGGVSPYWYLWSNGATNDTLNGLCGGLYNLTVGDVNGCVHGFNIVVPSAPGTMSLTASNFGFNCTSVIDTTAIAISGGQPPYMFNWGDGTGSIGHSPGIHYYSNPGEYYISVRDSNLCTNGIRDTVVNTGIWVGVLELRNSLCTDPHAGKIKIGAFGHNGPPYSYLWNNGSTADSLVGIASGNYSVTVTDTTGCRSVLHQNVNQTNYEPGYYAYVACTGANCGLANGSVTTTVNGGTAPFTYLWNNGATTPNLSDVAHGSYSLTVTDGLGCLANAQCNLYGGCFNIITGKVFNDVNGDCQPDSGESPLTGTIIKVTSGSYLRYGYSDANGYYSIAVPSVGPFTVMAYQVTGNCDNLTSCGTSSQTVTFNNSGGDTSVNNNFAFAGTPGFDLTMHPGWRPANPGFQKTFWMMGFNQGTLPVTGPVTMEFAYDSNLVYQNSSPLLPVHDSIRHTLTWIVNSVPSPIYDWNNARYECYFDIPASLNPSYQLHSSFSITPAIGDCDSSNNFMIFIQPVTGSRDPNEKNVSPSGGITEDDKTLTYTIHFQNTGTDSTWFIIIRDTLPPGLDPVTVRNVASSHRYSEFNISGTGVLTWVFNPLRLPDSLQSPDGSKGFVMFTINKNDNLGIGTTISNTAAIYFDYNQPVFTNTVSDTMSAALRVKDVSLSADVSVCTFPNPGSPGSVQFVVSDNLIGGQLQVFDALGRINSQLQVTDSSFKLITSGFSRGVYFYRIHTTQGKEAVGKLVLE